MDQIKNKTMLNLSNLKEIKLQKKKMVRMIIVNGKMKSPYLNHIQKITKVKAKD